MTWYHPGFVAKKAIIIPRANVSGGSDLPNFPVLVSVTSPDLKTVAFGGLVSTPMGLDLLFTDALERRELAYEIEHFDPSIGLLLAWVRVPLLSVSADTTVYLYFGNPTINLPLSNRVGTWDGYYSSVWHMGDGISTDIADSVSANVATIQIASMTTNGQISGAALFTGTQTIQIINTAGLDFTTGDTITLSVWAKRARTGIWQTLLSHGTGTGRDYQLAFSGGSSYAGSSTGSAVDTLVFLYRDSGDTRWNCFASSTASTDTTTWHHYGLTYTYGTPASAQLFIDGQVVGASWTNGTGLDVPFAAYDNLALGSTTDSTDGFYGSLDEVRVSKGTRHTAGWLVTDYTNQSNPSLFCTVGETVLFEGNVAFPLIVTYGDIEARTSALQCTPQAKGVQLVLTTTALQGEDTLLITLIGQDEVSGGSAVLAQWQTVGQVTGQVLGTSVYTYYPGLASSKTVTAGYLPMCWQVNVSPQANYPVSYTLMAQAMR